MGWIDLGLGAATGICAALFCGVVAFGIYDYFVAETFELRKDAWTCTRSHEEVITTFVTVGNSTIPQTSLSTVCDQWTRR